MARTVEDAGPYNFGLCEHINLLDKSQFNNKYPLILAKANMRGAYIKQVAFIYLLPSRTVPLVSSVREAWEAAFPP